MTSTRVVFVALLICVGVYLAPEAVGKVGAFLGDAVGANDAALISEGETALLVAANAKAVTCAPETIVTQKSVTTNRDAACPRSFPRAHGGQCDEYPMASTAEGGLEVRAEEVPARENRCQGGSYVRQYPPDGQRFLVMTSRPDLVATASFAGVDIAVEKDCG